MSINSKDLVQVWKSMLTHTKPQSNVTMASSSVQDLGVITMIVNNDSCARFSAHRLGRWSIHWIHGSTTPACGQSSVQKWWSISLRALFTDRTGLRIFSNLIKGLYVQPSTLLSVSLPVLLVVLLVCSEHGHSRWVPGQEQLSWENIF